MDMYVFKAPISRRMPDPVFPGCQRHVFMCKAQDLPIGLPTSPNPRAQNTDRMIWKDIRKHLLNEEGTPNTFHLKNKGITLLAQDVRKVRDEDDLFEVTFDAEVHGIVDGGHTYSLITQTMREEGAHLAENDSFSQFVKVEILIGFDRTVYAEVAGGLNTAIQVQEMSLANLRDEFEWIKDALADQPYSRKIAYRENEANCPVDVRDVVAMLYMFNIHAFPNTPGEHPVAAYSSKARVLDHYLKNIGEYRTLRDILPDILALHDTIAKEARDLHNSSGGRGGMLAFVEGRKRGQHEFPFTGESSEYKLARAALYPMLGAFRWMVTRDDDSGMLKWRRGFDGTLALWRSEGARLMKQTQATSDDNNRKVHAIGRSSNHWQTLYSSVVMADLMAHNAS